MSENSASRSALQSTAADTQLAEQPLLSISNLKVDFTTGAKTAIHAVRDASLSVYPGQWVAIVGESGSGKSTLAMAVLGLLPGTGKVTGGSIMLQGQDLVGVKPKAYERIRGRQVGLVPQDPMSNLNPVWRIGTQVKESLVANGVDVRREKRSQLAKDLLESEAAVQRDDDELLIASKELPSLIDAAREALERKGTRDVDGTMRRFEENWIPGSYTRWRVANDLTHAGIDKDESWSIAKRHVNGSTMNDRVAGLLAEAR